MVLARLQLASASQRVAQVRLWQMNLLLVVVCFAFKLAGTIPWSPHTAASPACSISSLRRCGAGRVARGSGWSMDGSAASAV